MKTYHRVISRYFYGGKIAAHIETVRASGKPESEGYEMLGCDVYIDYFDSEAEASAFIAQNKTA